MSSAAGFLLHVLPRGLVRIRYYGFLANGCRARLLSRCRDALGQPDDAPVRPDAQSVEHDELLRDLLPQRLNLCPNCGRGPLRTVELIARSPPAYHPSRRVAA